MGVFESYPNKGYLPEPSYLGGIAACRQIAIPFLANQIAGMASAEKGTIGRPGSGFFFSMEL
jgi:hypothetical protein